jgi:hypothetical protein
VLCLALCGFTLLLASVNPGCGTVTSIEADASPPPADASPPPADVSPDCIPDGEADLPDDNFEDTNCDGIDGDASDAIFVDPIEGSNTGDGSQSRPKASLLGNNGAFAAAVATGKSHVFISTGTLSESETVVVPDGISVWGGYDAAQSWARSDSIDRPVVEVAATIGVRFENTTSSMTWDRVDVRAADATAEGTSSYGMFMNETSSELVISNATITAGSGAHGADSVRPATPETPLAANGSVGSGLVNSVCCESVISDNCVAGAPGQSACAFAGGVGARCGRSGGQPTAGEGPDGGAAGGLREQGKPGGPGAPGGEAEPLTEAVVTVGESGYTPLSGTTGTDGSPGSGGGGGGLDYEGSCSCGSSVVFPPGHGGGAGGCGGTAAPAAGGGGGSFALFLFDSSPTLDRITLESGTGGDGGVGSEGGAGGSGGLGGGQPSATAAGGNGGDGGAGGASSGGPGGPSICLTNAGASDPVLVTTPNCLLGEAGAGGTAPNPDLDGLPGLALEVHSP